MPNIRFKAIAFLLPLGLLSACGGGASSTPAFVFPPPPATALPFARLSAASPFDAACSGNADGGTLYVNAEVEPRVAVDPANAKHLIAVWQQDRWSNGGARGALASISLDGGQTWQMAQQQAPFSPCTGGAAGSGQRISDPWIALAADGTAYQAVLNFTGDILTTGSSGAVSVSRSTDGGLHWSNPVSLIQDGDQFFNDKDAIAADPTNANYVYAVWDRLAKTGGGPAYFARTTDGGATWEAARPIYDPGAANQTLGNQIAVLPDGTLANVFTEIDGSSGAAQKSFFALIRSTDRGVTWSAPIRIADDLSVGTVDPQTGATVRDAGDIPEIAVAADGSLNVVWQDARFGNGQHDAIALSRSTDGGLSWSAPVPVNGDTSVSAFIPTVAVLADGTIGVTYYDFRDDTADPGSLPTDVWLATSRDGRNWQESKILGPFDLAAAPDAEGLFVGDYEGLVASGNSFVPVLAQANHGDLANRTDVYALLATPASTDARAAPLAMPAAVAPLMPEFAARVRQHLLLAQQWRRRAP